MTNLLLEETYKGGRITKEEYVEKMTTTNDLLRGNGRQKRKIHHDVSLTERLEHEVGMLHTFDGDCLFGSAVIEQQSSLIAPTRTVDFKKLDRKCRTQVQEHMMELTKVRTQINGRGIQV